MKELNKEPEALVHDFKNHRTDLTKTVDNFEMLIKNYIALKNDKLSGNQINTIEKALLTTLLKIKGVKALENKILTHEEDNAALKSLLGLS